MSSFLDPALPTVRISSLAVGIQQSSSPHSPSPMYLARLPRPRLTATTNSTTKPAKAPSHHAPGAPAIRSRPIR